MLPALAAVIFLTKGIIAQDCTNHQDPVLAVDYSARGTETVVATMDTYETGWVEASKVLIGVFDIYGFNPGNNNTRQIADRLADYGYRVVIPDWFHGQPWAVEHEGQSELDVYNSVFATSWNESVRDDLGLVLNHYKGQGAMEFGLFGFCFGGKIAALAVDTYSNDIKIAAQFHPAGIDVQDSARIKSPTILLPGANDADMTDYCSVINILLGDGSCVYRHARQANHGYAGSRADWTNVTIKGEAEAAVGAFEQFLCDKFPTEKLFF